ncbi:MAG: hypothetical protein ChlgKO_12120 [Chlamydiales bacterium]
MFSYIGRNTGEETTNPIALWARDNKKQAAVVDTALLILIGAVAESRFHIIQNMFFSKPATMPTITQTATVPATSQTPKFEETYNLLTESTNKILDNLCDQLKKSNTQQEIFSAGKQAIAQIYQVAEKFLPCAKKNDLKNLCNSMTLALEKLKNFSKENSLHYLSELTKKIFHEVALSSLGSISFFTQERALYTFTATRIYFVFNLMLQRLNQLV